MQRQGKGFFGWILIAALFLGVVSMANLAPAQGPGGPGGPGGKSQGQRLLTPEDRAAMGQIFWHRLQERLGLTDQQLTDLRTTLEQRRQAVRPDVQALMAARKLLRAAMASPTADAATIQAAADQVKAAQNKLFDSRIQTRLALRAKLTPEQLAKWNELRHGMQHHRMGHRGGGWGHGGGFSGGMF